MPVVLVQARLPAGDDKRETNEKASDEAALAISAGADAPANDSGLDYTDGGGPLPDPDVSVACSEAAWRALLVVAAN